MASGAKAWNGLRIELGEEVLGHLFDVSWLEATKCFRSQRLELFKIEASKGFRRNLRKLIRA